MARVSLTELPGGQRIVSERLAGVRSVAIGYWIGVGSRDETEAQAGLSHFIEHLLFKGTSDHGALEIAEIFDELGAELNAATSREHTVLFTRVPDTGLETALEVMGGMVFSPRFEDLESEREVVLEEIAMYEDTPQDLVHDLLGEAVFAAHPLGRRVIGEATVISGVDRRALRAYHRSYYAPANVVVAAAGRIEHPRLVELVAAQAKPPASARTTRRPSRPPLGALKPGLAFQRKDTEQYHVCLGAPGVSRSDERRFAASVLDTVLGGSASSRLFQEIREKRGLAYAVYSFTAQYADTGQIGIYLGTREENLAEALAITFEQLAEIASGKLADVELARAKENLCGRLLLSLESTSLRMQRLGKALVTGTDLLSPERIIAAIERVERDDVRLLAAELLAPERLSAAAIGPSEERFSKALAQANSHLAAAA